MPQGEEDKGYGREVKGKTKKVKVMAKVVWVCVGVGVCAKNPNLIKGKLNHA